MHYHRNEREEFITYLTERFPKCFFQDPPQRRPLKKNIIEDLERAKVLDGEKLAQTLQWYQSHLGYQYSLVAGSPRIDLDGNRVGTVTEQEQMEAQKRATAIRDEMKERRAPVTVAKPRRAYGADEMSKTATPAAAFDPGLADIQSALVIANGLLTDKAYAPMRATLASTALRSVVERTEALIESLSAPSN